MVFITSKASHLGRTLRLNNKDCPCSRRRARRSFFNKIIQLYVLLVPLVIKCWFFRYVFTQWQVVKHGHNSEAIYTLQNNATKLYAQVYHETFVRYCVFSTPHPACWFVLIQNATLMVAEKIATPLELEYIGEHEWMVSLSFILTSLKDCNLHIRFTIID